MKYDAQIFSLKLDEDACYPFQSFICFINIPHTISWDENDQLISFSHEAAYLAITPTAVYAFNVFKEQRRYPYLFK